MDISSREPINGIVRLANGTRNELQIDHIPLEAGISLFSLDPRELVVLKTGFFSLGTISTNTAFSGISYEKSVQEKDPGNRENDGYGARNLGTGV